MSRKKALITGASSGIGKAFAYELARDGYDLALVARREELLKVIKKDLQQEFGVSVDYVSADISTLQGTELVARKIQDIDLLINDAGLGAFGGFLKTELERELFMIDLNIKGLYYLCKIYSERMSKKKSGGIINVASLAGVKPFPTLAVYAATKSFVLNFSQSISKELEEYGIRVMALCPGSTSTEFFQASVSGSSSNSFYNIGGIMKPETVAKEGWDAFKKGKRVYIPGLQNKVSRFFTSLMPNGLFLNMIYGFLKEKSPAEG